MEIASKQNPWKGKGWNEDSQNTMILMDIFEIAKNSVHQSLAGGVVND